jgi:hypothetical protein
MNETEALFRISELANGRQSFSTVVAQIELLLEKHFGGKGIFLDDSGDAALRLDSMQQPYRSLYTVDLRDGGLGLGKATLLFASDKFQGDLPRRLAEFIGEQLGMLFARTRLAQNAAELRLQVASLRRDLAARKVLQRAEGILVARRGMLAIAARRWIEQQSAKTGLTIAAVADRIIAYDQARALKIA